MRLTNVPWWLFCPSNGTHASSTEANAEAERAATSLFAHEVEIDVFDAQLQALLKPEPGAVQQRADDPHCPGQPLENPAHLFTAQDDGEPSRHPGARYLRNRADLHLQNSTIEAQHRAERVVLGRRG